jgi:hypothetical protein
MLKSLGLERLNGIGYEIPDTCEKSEDTYA